MVVRTHLVGGLSNGQGDEGKEKPQHGSGSPLSNGFAVNLWKKSVSQSNMCHIEFTFEQASYTGILKVSTIPIE